MKSTQASPAGASTATDVRPSARMASVTCYQMSMGCYALMSDTRKSTYTNEGDRIYETLHDEGVSGYSRESCGRLTSGYLP